MLHMIAEEKDSLILEYERHKAQLQCHEMADRSYNQSREIAARNLCKRNL